MTGTPTEGPLWLHPDDDIAPNRPGEGLVAQAESGDRQGALRQLAARVLGRAAPAYEATCELRAAQQVGAELDRLAGGGWRILHSVPLPAGLEIGHLMIGPAGVFCVRASWCGGARVQVGLDCVRAGGRTAPVVRHCRRAAALAEYALARAVGTEVVVRAVVVPVAAATVGLAPQVADVVWVLREGELAQFGRLGGELRPAAVEQLYDLARDRRTWNVL